MLNIFAQRFQEKMFLPSLVPLSLQLDSIQNCFWSMITKHVFSPIKFLYEPSSRSYSKIIFHNDYKNHEIIKEPILVRNIFLVISDLGMFIME